MKTKVYRLGPYYVEVLPPQDGLEITYFYNKNWDYLPDMPAFARFPKTKPINSKAFENVELVGRRCKQ